MDELLSDVISLNIGAKINHFNTSILAYCDDLLLLSKSEAHMNKILDCCNNYAVTWKLEFNASKSISYSSNGTQLNDFILGSLIIRKSNGFVYLGLPIGNDRYVEEFFSEKF